MRRRWATDKAENRHSLLSLVVGWRVDQISEELTIGQRHMQPGLGTGARGGRLRDDLLLGAKSSSKGRPGRAEGLRGAARQRSSR